MALELIIANCTLISAIFALRRALFSVKTFTLALVVVPAYTYGHL